MGTGLINAALKPVPVEEQPAARTAVAPRVTASKVARLMWIEMAPEQCLPVKLVWAGRVVLTMCLFISSMVS